jgi:NitT/TauT family transport system ATP-binding protein
MTDPGEARLVVENACLRFGPLDVLHNLSLNVGGSEIVSIVGPSGCGKTTLLRCVGGLSRLNGGKIRIDGQVVEKPSPSVSMVFQHFGLFPWKSLWSNIAYGLTLRRTPKSEIERRVAEAIELVGLRGFEKSYPHQLSGGMQQRVALCRALIHRPRLLLMDEPFGALDELTRMDMNDLLLRIRRETKASVLFVTHSISEAVYLSDKVVVFSKRPARVAKEIPIPLSYPRSHRLRFTAAFTKAERIASEALGVVAPAAEEASPS